MDMYREALPNLAVADVQMAYDISRHILSVGSCTLLKFLVLLVCSSVACLFLCFLFVPMLLVCSYVPCLFQCCLFVPMLLVFVPMLLVFVSTCLIYFYANKLVSMFLVQILLMFLISLLQFLL